MSGRFELAVVDVSGKGDDAGTRALLLSGAFGGLLGALPPERFLPAANDYLLRQDWEEGFATAIHLSLDLSDGSFEVRTAGHPPAALRQAGTGRWTVLPTEGPILGLMPDAVFTAVHGRIAHHDALLLYTDGMVEEPRRDIDMGIDRMLGEAEHLLRGSFEGAARRLVDALGSRDDDRAMVVVSRRAVRGGTGRFPRSARARFRGPRGCSSMVEPQSSKLATRVRFPSSAPSRAERTPYHRGAAAGARFGGA